MPALIFNSMTSQNMFSEIAFDFAPIRAIVALEFRFHSTFETQMIYKIASILIGPGTCRTLENGR